MQNLTSRRSFLLGSGSTLALVACGDSKQAAAQGSDGPINSPLQIGKPTARDIEMGQQMAELFALDPANGELSTNMAALAGATEITTNNLVLARAVLAENPEKRWFYWPDSDAESFDYAHIARMGEKVPAEDGSEISTAADAEPFDLTPAAIARMVGANYFDHRIDSILADNPLAENRVVIALRGAEIVDGESGTGGFVRLRDIRPDHRTPRCVFIAWNKSAENPEDALRAFSGSTVPSELYLSAYQEVGGNLQSCMMPQGLHLREIGNMGKHHPNTLRQASVTPVLRAPSKETDYYQITKEKSWDPATPGGAMNLVGAHIHCAYWDRYEEETWKFSSRGCQTICGLVSRDTVQGEIKDFYEAMAIPKASLNDAGKYDSDKYGTVYPMVLLTGTEARLHARGASLDHMRRIRIGSSVNAEEQPDHPIMKFQEALKLNLVDGDFGARSMLKLIAIQSNGSWRLGLDADGIVTPDLAAIQGITLS